MKPLIENENDSIRRELLIDTLLHMYDIGLYTPGKRAMF